MKYAEIGIATNTHSGIVGIVAIYCNNQETLQAYITLMAVRSHMRSRGIGTKLLGFAIQRARSLGMREIELRTWDGNEAAINHYQRFGFRA